MKSIKPGRGPSMMGGMMGIFVALFGVFWTIAAASMGAFIMVPFGLIFICIAIVMAVYEFKNATSKNRYSMFDITDGNEEPDPLNQRYGTQDYNQEYDYYGRPEESTDSEFCPYCGNPVEGDYRFCNKCGKELP